MIAHPLGQNFGADSFDNGEGVKTSRRSARRQRRHISKDGISVVCVPPLMLWRNKLGSRILFVAACVSQRRGRGWPRISYFACAVAGKGTERARGVEC